MRRRASHIGRLRIAAADILSRDLGFRVDPSDIKPATGAWRTDWRLDVYRWELFTRDDNNRYVVAGCWETLTEFVKQSKQHGCYMHDDVICLGKPA